MVAVKESEIISAFQLPAFGDGLLCNGVDDGGSLAEGFRGDESAITGYGEILHISHDRDLVRQDTGAGAVDVKSQERFLLCGIVMVAPEEPGPLLVFQPPTQGLGEGLPVEIHPVVMDLNHGMEFSAGGASPARLFLGQIGLDAVPGPPVAGFHILPHLFQLCIRPAAG